MSTKSSKTAAASNVAALPAAKAPRVRPAPSPAADASAELPVVTAKAPLKKKEFVDRAAARSGVRKSDAKTAIEATLSVLAEALAQGQELVLPPLGKLRVTREKTGRNGRQLMIRLVPPKAGETAPEGLAEGED